MSLPEAEPIGLSAQSSSLLIGGSVNQFSLDMLSLLAGTLKAEHRGILFD